MEIIPLHTSIEKLFELKKGIVVLETPNGFPISDTNLYLIDHTGKILWKAEKPSENALFTKARLNEDYSISTFTNNGQFCEIDTDTGKIISSSSFK